jgi:hypothetical protein
MPSTIGVVASGYLTQPADIPNLQLWFDAADATTITESGGLVSQWDDKSGNGRNLSQSGGAQPTTGTQTINGLNVIDFDGVDDFLLSTSFSLSQPLYIWSVFNLPVDAVNDADLFGSVSPVTVIRPRWSTPPGTNALMFAGSTGLQRPRLVSGNYIWGVFFSGSSSNNRLNGVGSSNGNAGTSGIAQFRVGRGGNTNLYLQVRVAEMLIYSSALTSDQVSSIENYLNQKWAIY